MSTASDVKSADKAPSAEKTSTTISEEEDAELEEIENTLQEYKQMASERQEISSIMNGLMSTLQRSEIVSVGSKTKQLMPKPAAIEQDKEKEGDQAPQPLPKKISRRKEITQRMSNKTYMQRVMSHVEGADFQFDGGDDEDYDNLEDSD